MKMDRRATDSPAEIPLLVGDGESRYSVNLPLFKKECSYICWSFLVALTSFVAKDIPFVKDGAP
jgi:hypothetical protein